MNLSLGALEGIPGVMSRKMVQHVQVGPFRVGMVSSSWGDPHSAQGAQGAGPSRRGTRPAARVVPSDAPLSAAAPRRQEELRLVASRLACYDMPTLSVLQSVSSGLIETWNPMLYF